MRNRTWHIHLGAHKTATTHLQTGLAMRQDALRAKGVFFLPLEQTREMLMFRDITKPWWWRLLNLRKRARKELAFASEPFVRRCAQSVLEKIEATAGGSSRIVLSEENLLGTTGHVFAGRYFTGTPRLNLIRALSEHVPVKLYFSTRPLDSFLPSAYAQALRTTPADQLRFDKTLARDAHTPPSWADLVDQIRTRVPNAKLTVWDYADYAGNALEIQSLITGCELDTTAEIAPPKSTKSPSATAIAKAEAITETRWKERLSMVNAIYDAYPATQDSPAFRPIPPQTKERLQAAYQKDLERIAAMANTTLLSFG